MKGIKLLSNKDSRNQSGEKASTEFMSQITNSRVRKFHQKFPNYQPTPLHFLTNLANRLNIRKLIVKDESFMLCKLIIF